MEADLVNTPPQDSPHYSASITACIKTFNSPDDAEKLSKVFFDTCEAFVKASPTLYVVGSLGASFFNFVCHASVP